MNPAKQSESPLSNYLEKSNERRQLFVLVRHSGCTFCRETLDQLSKAWDQIQGLDMDVYVVHMGLPESGAKMKQAWGLDQVEFLSDPEKQLYKAFGARRGRFNEVLGLNVFKQGIFSGAVLKYGVGALEGDGFQLGGTYLIKKGQISCLHHPQHAGDLENWKRLIAKL